MSTRCPLDLHWIYTSPEPKPDPKEYRKRVERPLTGSILPPLRHRAAELLFRKYDYDESGTLEMDEFKVSLILIDTAECAPTCRSLSLQLIRRTTGLTRVVLLCRTFLRNV